MQENSLLHDYLNKRHISDSIISEFNVHWGTNPILGECIVFPINDFDGNFLYNKYRRSPIDLSTPKYLYDKGGHVTLYGWHKAKNEKSILIVEGESDCLVALSANIPCVTSTGGAMSFQQEWGELFADKEVTLLFDNDEAGAKGMVKALKYIPHAYICFLPDRPGIKDISDFVSAGGDLSELLRTRVRFSSMQDVIDDRSKRLSLWQSVFFHNEFEKEHSTPTYVKPTRPALVSNEILRAKSYPIDQLIKIDRNNMALCLWHNEKTPSLHYYRSSNIVYCFGGCGKPHDAIDVYKQLHHCSFKEAVKELNNI